MASTISATWDSQLPWPDPSTQLHGCSSYATPMGDWYREGQDFPPEVAFGESIELDTIIPDALALEPPVANLTTKETSDSYLPGCLTGQLLSNNQNGDNAAPSIPYALPNQDETHTAWMTSTSTLGLLVTPSSIHNDQATPAIRAHSTKGMAQDDTHGLPPPNTPSHENESSNKRTRTRKHPASFKCELCPSSFTRNTTLREHVRAHFGHRRFRCTICHKTFVHMKSWNRHDVVHSQEKRFICNGTTSEDSHWGCGHRFSREDGLVAHLQSQTGRNCLQPLVESGEIYQPLQDVSSAEFTCEGFLSNGQQWGCGQKFLNRDDVNTHFDSKSGQSCLRHFIVRCALGLQKAQQDDQKQREDNNHSISPTILPQEDTGFAEREPCTNSDPGVGSLAVSEREPESVVGTTTTSSKPRLWTRLQDGSSSNSVPTGTDVGAFRPHMGMGVDLIMEPAMQKGERAQPLSSKKRVRINISQDTTPQGPLRLTLQPHCRVLQEHEISDLNLRSSNRLESLTGIFISFGNWECQVEWSLYFSEQEHGDSGAQFEYRVRAKAPRFGATGCRSRNQVPVVLFFHDSKLKGIGLRRSFDLGVFTLN